MSTTTAYGGTHSERLTTHDVTLSRDGRLHVSSSATWGGVVLRFSVLLALVGAWAALGSYSPATETFPGAMVAVVADGLLLAALVPMVVVGFWAVASVVPRSRAQVASGLAEADVEAFAALRAPDAVVSRALVGLWRAAVDVARSEGRSAEKREAAEGARVEALRECARCAEGVRRGAVG